jgi:O-antigen ligase
MSRPVKIMALDRNLFARLADGFAVALAASLPWSTSGTSILAGLWLLAIIPTIDPSSLRRFITNPAAAFTLIFVALGAAGMLWADAPWAERFGGVSSFVKLLALPLLLYQFSRSERGSHVLIGFLLSCVLLLGVSWLLLVWPTMPWPGHVRFPGVPVKDYIAQSAVFTVCIFAILQMSYVFWRSGRRQIALLLVLLALVFLANVYYVAASRTYLIVIPFLLVVFGYRLDRWKGATGLIIPFVVLAAAAWPSASLLRHRVGTFFSEIQSYQPDAEATSAGERLTFWIKSAQFIRNAPVVGHGTGSIRQQFRGSVAGQTGMAAEVSANPHNQILAVGIQLGLIGVAALLAMWTAHLALFWSGGLAAWVGLVVVIQNIVGSLFNSHLFDFTHGWIYVVGVGVAGGIALKELNAIVQ